VGQSIEDGIMSNAQSAIKRGGSALTVGFCLFLVIAVFFLWTEHRARLFGILPYLILLACPFIHLFMHRGHGGHGNGDRESIAREGSGVTSDAAHGARHGHHPGEAP